MITKKTFGLCSVFLLIYWALSSLPVSALQLTSRFIEISSATPSATANHNFQFTLPSTTTLGSIVFYYCENSALLQHPCTPPPGLDVLSAALSAQTGNTGFSIDVANSTANKIVLTRTPAAGAIIASTYNFSGIINPSTAGSTEFVRITTYPTIDGSGPYTDNGTVAFATIPTLNVGASVPPFLSMCAAISVAIDCSSASGSSIDFGNFSASSPRSATSQFAIASNSVTGHVVYTLGTTMTSGNNTITPLSFPTANFPGNSQFGINLRDNSSPNVGGEPDGSGTAIPTPDYNLANLFTFRPGDLIASSNLPSDYNRMTISYMANINASQPVGVYSTTITYLGVAQF